MAGVIVPDMVQLDDPPLQQLLKSSEGYDLVV